MKTRDCPYCDGELTPMSDPPAQMHECSNTGSCPATFVWIYPGTAVVE